MTLAEQIVSDVTSVFLNTDDFAESVTLLRSDGSVETVTAIVHYMETQTDGKKGLSHQTPAKVEFAESVTVDTTDCVFLNDVKYPIVHVEPAVAGFKRSHTQHSKSEYRTVGGEVM